MSHENGTVTLDDDNFEQEVLQSDQPVLVDFWAEWCGPCRMLGPIIESLAADYAGRVKVGKLDVDAATKVAGRFGIRSIPTVMLFQGGEVQATVLGVRPQQEYVRLLDGVITPLA